MHGLTQLLFKYLKGYYFPDQAVGKSEGRDWHLEAITFLLVAGSGILQMTLSLHRNICPQHFLTRGSVLGAQDTTVTTQGGPCLRGSGGNDDTACQVPGQKNRQLSGQEGGMLSPEESGM